MVDKQRGVLLEGGQGVRWYHLGEGALPCHQFFLLRIKQRERVNIKTKMKNAQISLNCINLLFHDHLSAVAGERWGLTGLPLK